jgi:ATP-dependent protease HslVU (ClpYQ) ATPase subunit
MLFLKTETFKTLVKNQKFENIKQANTILLYLIDAIDSLQAQQNESISKARIQREILWASEGATPEVAKALRKLAKELAL